MKREDLEEIIKRANAVKSIVNMPIWKNEFEPHIVGLREQIISKIQSIADNPTLAPLALCYAGELKMVDYLPKLCDAIIQAGDMAKEDLRKLVGDK